MKKINIVKVGFVVGITGLIINGCGGGSGASAGINASSGTGTDIAGIVEIITDADAVAYQKGNSSWKDGLVPKETYSDGTMRYTFNQNEQYGVAFYCNNDKHFMLFQLTTEESRLVNFKCGNITGNSSPISGKISDQTGDNPDGYAVAIERNYDLVTTNNGTFNITVPDGKRDLIAVSLKTINNKTVPQKFYIERDNTIAGADIAHDIVFNNTNVSTISGYDFSATNATKGEAYLVTSNNTYFTMAIDGKWYIPDNGLIEDDLITFYGEDSQKDILMLEAYKATEVPRQSKTLDVSHIIPLTGVVYNNTNTFYGLDYQQSTQNEKLRNYMMILEKTQTNEHFDLVLSSGWLGSVESYEIPDLSTLNGFKSIWEGKNADQANVGVIMSNKTIADIINFQKIFTPHGYNLPLLKDIKYEMATQKIF